MTGLSGENPSESNRLSYEILFISEKRVNGDLVVLEFISSVDIISYN
jgi:hypothetical protein